MAEGHTEGDARSIPLISAKEKQSSERMAVFLWRRQVCVRTAGSRRAAPQGIPLPANESDPNLRQDLLLTDCRSSVTS